MKFRKFLTIGIAALSVAAFSFGLAACKPETEDPGKDPETPGGDPVTPAEVTVEGGYGYYPPDQGGYGLELNLYEDGTFYYSQFTSAITYGTYTAEEATGTDDAGRTILYTVTFGENNVFGDGTHNIVQDGERVTKFVTVRVVGAPTPLEARKVAEGVAKSSLVKSSWNGGDPNWGRIIHAVGYSGSRVREEKVDIEPEALEGLVRIAHGDMRRAVNSLQVAASLGKRIDLDLVYQTAGMANPDAVKSMMETALDGNFIQARNQLDDLMITNGLSGQDIIKQIHSSIFDLGVSDYDKVKMIDKCGEVEFRIVEGSNDRIQLEVFLAYLVMVGGKAR